MAFAVSPRHGELEQLEFLLIRAAMKMIVAFLCLVSCSACSWLVDCMVESSLNNQSAGEGGPSLFHGGRSEVEEPERR